MYVKKRMSLLLFAALAMVLFTACGRWDFSREAAKAANEAQNAVVFEASATLAQSLKDALEDKVQTADVKAAMKADGTLTELLAGRSVLDVRFAAGDQSADDAAAAIAAQFGRLTGRKPEAFIAMVKADNGYFYAAIVSYRTGSSSSASDGNGGTTPAPGPDPDEGEDDDPVATEKYTITVTCGANGNVMYDGQSVTDEVEINAGESAVFTFDPNDTYEIDTVTVDDKKVENPGTSYTFVDGEDHTINVTFKKCAIIGLTVETIEGTFKDEYWVCYNDKHGGGEKLDLSGLKVKATYSNGTWEDVTSECTFDPDTNYEFTKADARNGQKTIFIKHPDFNSTQTVTVTVHDVYTQISPTDVHGEKITFKDGDIFTPKGMMISISYYVNGSFSSPAKSIEITQEMIDNGEVTFDAIKLKGGIGKNRVSVTYRGQKNIFDVYVY